MVNLDDLLIYSALAILIITAVGEGQKFKPSLMAAVGVVMTGVAFITFFRVGLLLPFAWLVLMWALYTIYWILRTRKKPDPLNVYDKRD